MRRFMFKAAVLSAVMLLSSCANGEENVESVTVALTTETALEQLTEETSASAFLGDYTEPALPDSVTVFGTEYPTDGQTLAVTVDADLFSEMTEEDLKGIEILKAQGLERLDVLNCKEHDLSFLAKAEMSCIRFYDMEGGNFEYLRQFTAMEKAELEGFGGETQTMLNLLIHTNVKNVTISDRNYDMRMGYTLGWGANTFCVSYLPRETALPDDSPYIKPSPLLNTYDENNTDFSLEIFNPTDEDIIVDGVVMSAFIGGELIHTSEGNSYLKTDVLVPAGGSAEIGLAEDIFDFSSAENGLYQVEIYYGDNGGAFSYFILNSSEKRGLDSLPREPREIYEKAQSYIPEMLSADTGKTAGDYTDAFTLECAERIMSSGVEKVDIEGDGNCFYCIRDADGVAVVRYTIYGGEDGTRIEMHSTRLVRKSGSWRVDNFAL